LLRLRCSSAAASTHRACHSGVQRTETVMVSLGPPRLLLGGGTCAAGSGAGSRGGPLGGPARPRRRPERLDIAPQDTAAPTDVPPDWWSSYTETDPFRAHTLAPRPTSSYAVGRFTPQCAAKCGSVRRPRPLTPPFFCSSFLCGTSGTAPWTCAKRSALRPGRHRKPPLGRPRNGGSAPAADRPGGNRTARQRALRVAPRLPERASLGAGTALAHC
jgi:hypothetical protein